VKPLRTNVQMQPMPTPYGRQMVIHPFSCVGIPGFGRGGKRICGLL
jgi:hypothetical protein